MMIPLYGLADTVTWRYVATDEEIAAANCTNEKADIDPSTENAPPGQIDGRYTLNDPSLSGTNSFRRPSDLFYASAEQSKSLYLETGGNTYLRGKLVPWNHAWLFCPTFGGGAFRNIDTSQPYARIIPDNETLRDDGRYAQFRIERFWQSSDPLHSARGPSAYSDYYFLDVCPGEILVEDRCIPLDLTRLDISSAQLEDISFLSQLTELEYLDLSYNPVRDLSPLRHLTSLRELNLGEMRHDEVLDLSPLADLPALVMLNISENPIDSLSALSELSQLERLVAFGTDIRDLTPLTGLQRLRILQVQDTLVTDLAPAGRLSNLEQLYLGGTDITDMSVLRTLPKLEFLSLPAGGDIVGHAHIQQALAQ